MLVICHGAGNNFADISGKHSVREASAVREECSQTTHALLEKEAEACHLRKTLKAERSKSSAREDTIQDLQEEVRLLKVERERLERSATAQAGQLVKTCEEVFQLNVLLEQRRGEIVEAGEQLVTARAAAEDQERALAEEVAAMRAELGARKAEMEAAAEVAEAARVAAGDRERAMAEELESVQGTLEDERSKLKAKRSESEERANQLAAELVAAAEEVRQAEERGRRLEGELAQARLSLADADSQRQEIAIKLQMDLEEHEGEMQKKQSELITQGSVLTEKEADLLTLKGTFGRTGALSSS